MQQHVGVWVGVVCSKRLQSDNNGQWDVTHRTWVYGMSVRGKEFNKGVAGHALVRWAEMDR